MTKPLTRSERLVLLYLMEDLSNDELAEVIGITKHTVKVHKYNLYKKLGYTKMPKYEVHKNLVAFGEDNEDLFVDLFAPLPKESIEDADDKREGSLAGLQVHPVCQIPHDL